MDNLSRTLEDFDLAHILDNSADGRMPALQCMTDNGGPRLWLMRPAEDWRRIAADTAIAPNRLRSDTPVLPPYLSAGSWSHRGRRGSTGSLRTVYIPHKGLGGACRSRAVRPTRMTSAPTLAMRGSGA